MKNYLLVLAVALMSYLNAFPQVTSLTIDCQNPGWLASYISPTDVQSIRSLRVTGTINSTDLSTIGNLVKNYQLHERLDLENVDIEGNMLSGEMFGVTDCQLQYLSLPLSVTKLENCVNWVKLDTLVCGSENMPVFGSNGYLPKIDAKHLILREGVVYFMYSAAESPIEEIVFPNSLKYIYGLSGNNLSKINIPPAVEHLGSIIGTKLNLNGDTLYIPNSVKCLYDSWGTGGYRNGYVGSQQRDENGRIKCVYLPEGLDTLWVSELYGFSGSPYTEPGAKVDIHIKAKTPPRVENGTFGYNTIVYVPVGYKDAYKQTGTGTQYEVGQWGGATILEEIYAERIDITSPDIMYVGDSYGLKAEFTPYNTSFTDVAWSVSDGEILSITQDGLCTTLRYGEVQVTATNADRSCTDTKTIRIYNHTEGISLSNNSLTMKIGTIQQLQASTLPLETSDGRIKWSTSNDMVASVGEDGMLKAVGRGTCTITATSIDGGYTADCLVTVLQPVEAVIMEKHSMSMKVGETENLFVQASPSTADNKTIIWSSSDEQIAQVNNNGEVTALKAGEAWILAVSNDNAEAKDSCKVFVQQPVNGITLNHNTYQMNGIGESFSLEAIVSPDDASNKEINWKSSNESVCIVSNGTVVAVGEGTCVIIATSVDGGFIATCTVVVSNDTSIQDIFSINGDTYQLFDIQGRKQNTFHKGVNLIRFTDGTIKKVFIK